jgi:hypothetical protein
MKCTISNSFVFIFWKMANRDSRRGYLRVQAHAWILTGDSKPLVDFVSHILLCRCQFNLVE